MTRCAECKTEDGDLAVTINGECLVCCRKRAQMLELRTKELDEARAKATSERNRHVMRNIKLRERIVELVKELKKEKSLHLEHVEELRQGFSDAKMIANKHSDKVAFCSFKAYHFYANKIAVDLGGEDVLPVDWVEDFKEDGT